MAVSPRPCGPILVVEDDDACRSLIQTLVEQAGYPCSAHAEAESALAAAREDPPSLAVVDVCLPGRSGYEVCRLLREQAGPALPVIFVSGERVESYDRVAGLMVGADDYVTKPFAPDELVARIRALFRRARPAADDRGLTRREREVLTLLAEGLPQREIARRLVITPKTVGSHIEHILEKLGAHSRTEAVAIAYRADLVSLPA